MRVNASLGALAAVGFLGRSVAAPPPTLDPYGGEICTPTETTTIFVTVPDTNPATVPGDGGLQTATVTVPDSGAPGGPSDPDVPGSPGFPGSQTSVSPTFTLTLTGFPPSADETPYTGPKPWETRSTIATRTVTVFPKPQTPAPAGSDGSGSPPSSGDGAGGPGSPSGDGSPGQPGDGIPGHPDDGTPGQPSPDQPGGGTPGQPGDGTPGQPGDGTSGGPHSPKDDCVTVITTTLYHTGPAPSQGGDPTTDTVVATFTITFPDGSEQTQTPGTPDHGDHGPGSGSPHTTVITRTVYQPTLAPGQPTVSRDVIVETVTIYGPDGSAGSPSDGTSPPGVTPAPGDNGPVSVLTTTLYHPRTIDGDIVTLDTVVATLTVTFPPPSPTGPAQLPGGPGGPGNPSDHGNSDSVTFIPTTWYETTICPDKHTPTVKTHVSTIASTLAHQPSGSGVPGPTGPDSGSGGPGGPNDGDFVTVITETVYHPSPVPGSPFDPTPSVDIIVATITATFPHGSGSGIPEPDSTYGPEGPGDLVSVMTTTIYIPIATPGPSDPQASPGPDGDELPSDGGIIQTFTITIPRPSPAPGDHVTGAPPVPTSAPDHGSGVGDVGPVIITTLFHTTTHIGPDGQPTVAIDTFVATLTATALLSGISDAGPAPTGPHDGTAPYITIVTSTVTPTASSPDPYGAPGSGQPGASGVPEAPGSPSGPDAPGAPPGAPGSPSGPGGPGGPVGPDDSVPTVIVFTSTIYPPSGSATNPASPGGPGSPPQQTSLDDGSVTVLSATFTLTAPPGPGETGPGDVQTVVQTFTYTFPSAPPSDDDSPGGQLSATGPPAGTGVPTLDGAPDAYGSAVNTGTISPTPLSDPDADISGVIRLTSTGTITQTVPAGYGDGASGIPADGLFPPSQSGGFTILPIPNLPSGLPGPGEPSEPSHSSVSGQLPLPGQPSSQTQLPPSEPSVPGQPTVPGDGSTPDQTVVPGQVTDPSQPTVPGAPGNAATKTTCTTDLVPGAGSSAPGDGASGIGPVVVPPHQTTDDSLGSFPTDNLPDSYGFPTTDGLVPSGPSDGAPSAVSDSRLQTSGALPTLIEPPSISSLPSPDDDGSGLSSKDCSTGFKTLVISAVETSTFLNIIPQATTTYTFPYEALVTVHSTIVTQHLVPTLRRWFKRQEEDTPLTSAVFANTTSPAPTSGTEQSTEITLFPTTSAGNATTIVPMPTAEEPPSEPVDTSSIIETGTPAIPVQLPICTGATEVGNQILTFDTLPVGPLYNPYERIWFSRGFSIAPPPTVPFVPTSGGKLLEFVPPVVLNSSLDTAQFGVGVDAASDCFRFNFHGANLGCDAREEGQFCEFTFTGYRFNATLNAEERVMSQLAWVPSCPDLSECGLTPFSAENFNDITSVLVTLRVDGEPASWWADDIRFGWYDNSCEAGRCRAGTQSYTSRRETTSDGGWYWTPEGPRPFESRKGLFVA